MEINSNISNNVGKKFQNLIDNALMMLYNYYVNRATVGIFSNKYVFICATARKRGLLKSKLILLKRECKGAMICQ